MALAAVLVVLLFSPMLLGASTAGVELLSTPSGTSSGLPHCVSAHTYDSRGWGGFTTVRSDVRLIGCNNPAGHLQLSAGPICDAKSFLGAGQATCIATSDGSDLKVVGHFVYPFGLNLLAGPNTTTTFWIDHSGSYRS